MSRTFSTSRIQRDVIQHHGHSGSNQKPASSFLAILRSSRQAMGQNSVQHNYRRPARVPDRASRVGGVALPNLTRDQAAERAALVTVDRLPHRARPHRRQRLARRTHLPVGHDRRVRRTRRRRHLHRHRRRHRAPRHAQRRRHRRVRVRRVHRHRRSTGLAEHNVVVVDADCRYSNTGEGLHRFVDPVDDEVYLYSQFETADAKRMFACFDQPDLKATFDVTVTAPAHWQVISNGATASEESAGTGKVHTFATTPRMSTYLVALIAGPVRALGRRVLRRARRDPARHLLPRVAGRVHGRRAAVHRDQAGIRVLPPQLRRALRVRQVRPAVRARVQRGRNGERRRGDVPRGLRLPAAR